MHCYCKEGEFCRICEGKRRQRWPDAFEAQTRSVSDQVAMLEREGCSPEDVAATRGRFMSDVRR
jgi:hypothetical protein